MTTIKHKGLHAHRLRDNPAERRLAKAWAKINTDHGGQVLRYLLAKDNNRPADEMTARDAEVAATVIQWLGSPVGLSWLRDTLLKTEKA